MINDDDAGDYDDDDDGDCDDLHLRSSAKNLTLFFETKEYLSFPFITLPSDHVSVRGNYTEIRRRCIQCILCSIHFFIQQASSNTVCTIQYTLF